MGHPSGSKARKIRKRCTKCGRVALALRQARRCGYQPFGPQSYMCWGLLVPVRRPAKAVDAGTAYRAANAQKRDLARKQVKRLALKVAFLDLKKAMAERALGRAEIRASRYARRAETTDAELEQMRQRALHAGQVQKVRRRLQGRPAKAMTWVGPTVAAVASGWQFRSGYFRRW